MILLRIVLLLVALVQSWLIGSGGAPFDAQGKPQAANAVHGRTVTVAKNAGVWTYAVGKDRACLYSLWNW